MYVGVNELGRQFLAKCSGAVAHQEECGISPANLQLHNYTGVGYDDAENLQDKQHTSPH